MDKVPMIVGIERSKEDVDILLSKIKKGERRPISKKYEYVFGYSTQANVTQETNFRGLH